MSTDQGPPGLRPARPELRRTPTESLWSLREHDREAVDDELLRRMLPLAHKLAGRYRNVNEPFDDLAQVASIGLLRAIERFDPGHGAPFVSFAVPTILGELKRHFRDTGWTAHVPRKAQERALRIERAVTALTNELGREPQVGELADHLGLCTEDVLEGLDARAAHFAASLDAPANRIEGDEATLQDTFGREDDGYDLVELVSALGDGLRRLPFVERQVVDMRACCDIRQSEIAERLGCSQMQVSRLLGRARRRLAQVTAA
ncbi:MAG: sigma-70 family RNA polymerase sigma factor [Solirubrobacterales bacterium]|nr:sigma-70 family RNA polymerase sigma factor [Solirubrobacterales bacterium]